MICNKCGSEIENDAAFCTVCGARANEPVTIKKESPQPDFLNDDSDTTVLLSDEEIIDAFINEYGADSPKIGQPSDSSLDFFHNPGMTDSTDDLMPFNEYGADNNYVPKEKKQPKSFNDNYDTISFDAVEDDDSFYNQEEPPQDFYTPPQYEEEKSYAEQPAGDYMPPPRKTHNPKPKHTSAPTAELGFGRRFGAFIISFFAFFFLLVFSVTLSIKLGLSGDMVRNNISRMNPLTLLTSDCNGNQLSNTLYEALDFKNATGGFASEGSFRNYMLRSDFLGYIGQTADKYLTYIIDGKGSDPSITSEDFVYDFIKGNNKASIEEWGYSMTDSEYQTMWINLENEGFTEDMSVIEWGSYAGFSLRNLKFLFSFLTIGVFVIIIALMFVWTAVAVDGIGKYITEYFSGIFKAAAIFSAVIGLAAVIVPALAYMVTHQAVFYVLTFSAYTFAIIHLCIGLAEAIISRIFKSVNRKMN